MVLGDWVPVTAHWLMNTNVGIDNLSVLTITLFILATPVQFWLGKLALHFLKIYFVLCFSLSTHIFVILIHFLFP